mgnify:CR=1 FL=1
MQKTFTWAILLAFLLQIASYGLKSSSDARTQPTTLNSTDLVPNSPSMYKTVSLSLQKTEQHAEEILEHLSFDKPLYHLFSCSYLFSAGLTAWSSIFAEKAIQYGASFFLKEKKQHPLEDFSTIERDSRQWAKLKNLENKITLGLSNPHFLLGVATCTYQDSGSENCPDSQWATWELKKVAPDNRSGKSADLFSLYQTDAGRQEIISRLNRLGVNTYRFSIEWSHIEPREGEFHKEKLDIYINLCKALHNAKIQPIVTLHHFSEPKWFHEKGSFEKEENIQYFERYVRYISGPLTQSYKKSRHLVRYICTINEPSIEAFSRYIIQAYSPGCTLNFKEPDFFKRDVKSSLLSL